MKLIENYNVKAKLVIRCDVELSKEIKQLLLNASKQKLSNEDIASEILYAFLNPKIDALNEDTNLVTGSWDFICDFDGKLKNFTLETE